MMIPNEAYQLTANPIEDTLKVVPYPLGKQFTLKLIESQHGPRHPHPWHI